MLKGNTELSRELEPIVEIEAREGNQDWMRWHYTTGTGKRIEAYDEADGPGCYVPWLAVFSKEGRCIFRVLAREAHIFYVYRPR